MPLNRRFTLARRPSGNLSQQDFKLLEAPTPALQDGQFLLRNIYASLDPAMRGWLDDVPSYLPPVALGDPLRAATIGIVAETRNPAFPVGSWASGLNGIELFSVGVPGLAQPVDPTALPLITNHLSVVGGAGLAAYFGLLEVGRPQAGETVLISAAAGAVGSIAGQIAKLRQCRVIGIAGGSEKCERLLKKYHFDAAIDYRGKSVEELAAAIRAAAPSGIDVHFENVGGDILDAALLCLRPQARVVLCGMISEYNTRPSGARNLFQLIIQGARMEGVIVTQFYQRIPEAAAALTGWLKSGELVIDEHIEEGIENALPALLRLFDGSNTGKMILKLGDV
jgi:NADPH-dependent curcumin reductase CurA